MKSLFASFLTWLLSFFEKHHLDSKIDHAFEGWIKDDPDSRDQIYGETK